MNGVKEDIDNIANEQQQQQQESSTARRTSNNKRVVSIRRVSSIASNYSTTLDHHQNKNKEPQQQPNNNNDNMVETHATIAISTAATVAAAVVPVVTPSRENETSQHQRSNQDENYEEDNQDDDDDDDGNGSNYDRATARSSDDGIADRMLHTAVSSVAAEDSDHQQEVQCVRDDFAANLSDDSVEGKQMEQPEETLKDNEKYAVFFKMLRMGVPMPAVKNKMQQKGVNPQILDLGEEALLSRVLALERAYEAEQKQLKVPKKKGETIHWEAIPDARLVNRETVFGGSDFELEVDTLQHVQDLLTLFQKPPQDQEKTETEGKTATIRQAMASMLKKERAESVLDSRRAQAISIAMKKLRILPDQPAKFTWAIREMNENVLSAQALEVLLSCPLWPVNDEEYQLLRNKVDSGGKLAEPDKLILFVYETVPDVVARINALAFRWEFESSLAEAKKAAEDIKIASQAVLTNNNLKVVIRSAIMIGNAINKESGIQIRGCTLNSLCKMASTKTVRDKTITALDCVATYCLRCYPDFSLLGELIPFAMSAKKIELEAQIQAIRDMRRGLEAVRKMRQMESFVVEAMQRLDMVESEVDVARDSYRQLLVYFGLEHNEAGEMDTNLFFQLLAQFIELWGKALAKRQKELKTQAAQVLADAAAKKAADRAALKAAERAEKERQRQEEADANRGKLRIAVQLKGLFGARGPRPGLLLDGSPDSSTTRRALESPRKNFGFNLESPRSASSNRKPRKSIFSFGSSSKETTEVIGGEVDRSPRHQQQQRPKGRRSIFWG